MTTILLYDSGMGGLTIYDAVRHHFPNARYLYCLDNAFFPYSEKSTSLLIERAEKIVGTLAEQFAIDMVVVACNTASTVVLPALRAKFAFPVVGTVPAIKPAAKLSQTKVIGLLATKGTIERDYVTDLIEKYAPDCTVEKIGSTALVEMAEQKQQTGKLDLSRLANEIKPWQHITALDTVILGCTHFPLVKDELHQLLPQVKYFVDPAEGIANRVASLLADVSDATADNIAFCTQRPDDFQQKEKVLKDWGFMELRLLAV
ncbi:MULTISPECIES: glutamate racemase [unclassified Lonepinella]|uniref:glutamate racemase n=1 Tax=unclassified Lonepinella TaxID=2642006 RepID=UPI0036DDA1BB